jgi:hypothetical protein
MTAMTKALARWKPARWTPAMKGSLPFGLSNIPVESYGGAGGGLLLGLLVGEPLGNALKISPTATTAILSAISVGIPLVLKPKKMISNQLANIFYGAGVGFGAATVLKLLQPLFGPPAAATTQAPVPAPASVTR